jgi:hypothetical protein
VKVACSTLGDWHFRAAELFRPLYQLMHRRLLHARVIHADDTPVKLRVVGSKSTKKAHLWVAIGDADYPYVVFDFTADYTARGEAEGRARGGALPRYGHVDEIAAMVAYLAGPEAGFVTGASLTIDGGFNA